MNGTTGSTQPPVRGQQSVPPDRPRRPLSDVRRGPAPAPAGPRTEADVPARRPAPARQPAAPEPARQPAARKPARRPAGGEPARRPAATDRAPARTRAAAPARPAAAAPSAATRTPGSSRGPGTLASGPRLNPVERPETEDERDLPVFGWDEILKHDRAGDFWVVFAGGVYDVSEWMYHHPGGAEAFLAGYGQNVTKAYRKAGHSSAAWLAAQSFKVGRLKKGAKPPRRPGRPEIVGPAEADAPAAPGRFGEAFPSPRPTAASRPEPTEAAAAVEVPWGVRWLRASGGRFTNWDVLNDTDSQLADVRRYGPVYACGLRGKRWRMVFVADPDLIELVAEDDEQFGKRVEGLHLFRQLASSGTGGIAVESDGDDVERVRRVVQPWYAPAQQRAQFERVREQARKLTAAWSGLADTAPLDVGAWMQRYCMEVAGLGACNYAFGLLDGPEAAVNPLAAAIATVHRRSLARVVEPRPDVALPGTARSRANQEYRRERALATGTLDHVVRGRLGTCPVGPEQTDLLTRLLTTPDPDSGAMLTPEEVRDQLLLHLAHGADTPAVTAAWVANALATYPDVEDRVVEEVDAVSGGDPEHELRHEQLLAMPYLTQVIKETLRLHPPVPVTVRRSLKDGMLGRYRLRKDDVVVIGALAAHRDPRYWGPDAEVFDPDQFAVDKVVSRPPHAFMPFGTGNRGCVAQEATYLQLRVALFEIYSRYRLRAAPGSTVRKQTAATAAPAQVLVVREPRGGPADREAERRQRREAARRRAAEAQVLADRPAWDRPSEIPEGHAYRHLVVAYGSSFGSSKDLAERYAERGETYGYVTDVVHLDDLVDLPLRLEPWLLVVLSGTYTSSPPSNAIAFGTWLERAAEDSESWQHCHYLVWGLGNSSWDAFLVFPRWVDARLAELGAHRLAPLGVGDVSRPTWQQEHAAWNDRTWPQLLELSGARPSEAAAARLALERAADLTLTDTDSTSAMELSLGGQVVQPVLLRNAVGISTVAARVVEARELTSAESTTSIRHLELALPPGFAYAAGDRLGVCPRNDDDSVELLARELGVALDGVFTVPRTLRVRSVPRGVPLQVRNVLTSLVDIACLPGPALLDLLVSKATDPVQRARLVALRSVAGGDEQGDPGLVATVRAGGYDLLELLEEFDSVRLNLFELLQVAPPLRPRYYSTSSSPRVHGDGTAHLTVGSQVHDVPGMPHRQFTGLASHHLHSVRAGDRLEVFLDRSVGFRLQDDVARPMLFISAGTGLAPMRAFLWERYGLAQDGVRLGPAALFHGLRARGVDDVYADEIEELAREGVLDHVHLACSREVPGRTQHVQDELREQAALVWRLLKAGGHVYVCGSLEMREQVREAVASVLERYGRMSPRGAALRLAQLEEQGRYRTDVWG